MKEISNLNLIVHSLPTIIVLKRNRTYQLKIQEDQEMKGQINKLPNKKMETKVIKSLTKTITLMLMDLTQKIIHIV